MHTKQYIIFTILFLISLNLFSAEEDHKINTTSGISFGVIKNNVVSWDDIPYAKPPIGDLRWMSPRKFVSDSIITLKDNNFCVQRPSGMGGSEGDGYFSGTEDCLYLDIKAPKKSSDKALPDLYRIQLMIKFIVGMNLLLPGLKLK